MVLNCGAFCVEDRSCLRHIEASLYSARKVHIDSRAPVLESNLHSGARVYVFPRIAPVPASRARFSGPLVHNFQLRGSQVFGHHGGRGLRAPPRSKWSTRGLHG